jgi:hypothetical protein
VIKFVLAGTRRSALPVSGQQQVMFAGIPATIRYGS